MVCFYLWHSFDILLIYYLLDLYGLFSFVAFIRFICSFDFLKFYVEFKLSIKIKHLNRVFKNVILPTYT